VLLRLFALCALVFTVYGADLSGIWSGQTVDRNGDVQDVSFRFVQKGDSLTGKVYGDNESTAITDAKITGNEITFSVTAELNGQITKSVYSGTFVVTGNSDGDEMQLTRQRLGGNPAAAKAKGQNLKQTIKLKRVA
jgi:hypothetical protein